jgi:DNA-binding response OmpR family regulator
MMHTALLVEDDASLGEAIREALDAIGYATVVATTVDDAIRALGSVTFDVLVLDWMLVGETSDALLPMVRGRSPALLYSASPAAAPIADAWRIPFVSKPFDLDRFITSVELARTSGPASI